MMAQASYGIPVGAQTENQNIDYNQSGEYQVGRRMHRMLTENSELASRN